MKLVAIVGMTGSGKSVLAKYFLKKGYQLIRFGDITDEILGKKGLPLTEENERKLRESLRQEYGKEAYAKLNLEKIRAGLSKGNVVIDGLYSWGEYLLLKKEFPKMVVLAIYSPPEMRYDRLADREVRSLTREQAIERDKREIEISDKGGPIAMADYTLMNIYNLHILEENVNKFFEWVDENET